LPQPETRKLEILVTTKKFLLLEPINESVNHQIRILFTGIPVNDKTIGMILFSNKEIEVVEVAETNSHEDESKTVFFLETFVKLRIHLIAC
jgi:hypothetical protein